jgi:hypothetical protein
VPGIVSSLATELKKTVKPSSDTKVATIEDTKARKNKFLNILDEATQIFSDKLGKGNIIIKDVADLEKLIKLTLLVSGEANNIVGSEATTETTETTKLNAINTDIDSVADILDPNDPEVKAVFDKIFNKYNDANDEAIKK